MVRLGLLLIDIAFIIDGWPKKDREDREARENRRARVGVIVEGDKQGGPPVKEDLLLSRRFSCQGGWDREFEGGREGSLERGIGVQWE